MKLVLLAVLALLSIACAQNILMAAYSSNQCTSFFSAGLPSPLRPGVLASGICTVVGNDSLKVTDKGGASFDAALLCNAGCTSCLANSAGKAYGQCVDLFNNIAFGRAFIVTDNTKFSVSMFTAAGCTGTAAAPEEFTSVALPTSCQLSTALTSPVNILDVGNNKVHLPLEIEKKAKTSAGGFHSSFHSSEIFLACPC